jgi:membrane-associated protease RseP (regulator of RpoE activity)
MFFVLKNPLFGYINLMIGIFTTVPLSSTDGGSILKAVLEEFFPEKRASDERKQNQSPDISSEW